MVINRNDIYEMMSSILGVDVGVIKSIDENEDFSVHGMTSISAIQLVVMLEEKYEFEFKDEDLLLDKFNTYKKLFSLLASY